MLYLFILFNFVFPDVAFFNESLARYHKQHGMAEAIKEKRPIGMLLIDAVKMKSLMIPNPLRCLDVSTSPIKMFLKTIGK